MDKMKISDAKYNPKDFVFFLLSGSSTNELLLKKGQISSVNHVIYHSGEYISYKIAEGTLDYGHSQHLFNVMPYLVFKNLEELNKSLIPFKQVILKDEAIKDNI